MKFHVILILWGLLVGYVAYRQGVVDKVTNYVNPKDQLAAEKRVIASTDAGQRWVRKSETAADRGESMTPYRDVNRVRAGRKTKGS